MKLLVVATRGADKASTFYRWTQFEPVLERCGAEIEYLFKPQISRARLRQTAASDWIVNLRCLLNGFAARSIVRKAENLCFDFDDAIYTRWGRPYTWLTSRRIGLRLKFWLSRARLVTTSSQYLARYASRWAKRVEVVPMALDLSDWSAAPPREDDRPLRIGWAGSPVNLYQLEQLDGVLSRFLERHPSTTLAVYCGKRPALSCPFQHTPYEPGAESRFVRQLDVGLLPMRRDDFTMGKSPIKALQYLARAVPVVGNRFGATEEILDDTNSVRVDRESDWEDALETLLYAQDARERRRSLGHAGRQRVEESHDSTATASRLYSLLAEPPS